MTEVRIKRSRTEELRSDRMLFIGDRHESMQSHRRRIGVVSVMRRSSSPSPRSLACFMLIDSLGNYYSAALRDELQAITQHFAWAAGPSCCGGAGALGEIRISRKYLEKKTFIRNAAQITSKWLVVLTYTKMDKWSSKLNKNLNNERDENCANFLKIVQNRLQLPQLASFKL